MANSLLRLRGFNDLIGSWARLLSRIEEQIREVVRRYSVSEIRIPLLERVELFERSTGETSDIVEKQMFSFVDRDEAQTTVVLRPEGTPGVVRAYIAAGYDKSQPEQRFFYSGPMFRRERPQKGRYRQFFQFGVEFFGRADPTCDAELLIMIDDLMRDLGLAVRFEINSLGHDRPDCRPRFRAALLEYGRAHFAELCEDCHQRLERNPLRLLDCKIDAERVAQSAPKSLDYLCDECRKHFDAVRQFLIDAEVPYHVNASLVRGLDYYTRTAFEVTASGLGSQSTVAAGGRYDGLVETLGGASVPGIGFAIGLDRLALAMESNREALERLDSRLAADLGKETSVRQVRRRPDIAMLPVGEKAIPGILLLARQLREAGESVEVFSAERALKSQLKQASTIGATYALIVGDNELTRGVVVLRDLRTSTQREIARDAVVGELAAASRA